MLEVKEKISSYKELLIWKKGIEIVKETYNLTKTLPEEEKFGLFNQMRRSAVSIPSNIAEGWGRSSTGSYLQFLRISRGSLLELETQLIICQELDLIEKTIYDKLNDLLIEEGKMLNSFIRSIETKNN